MLIVVLGSIGGERFTINNLVGDEFATSIEWAIDLGSNAGDTLTISAGSADDEITLGDGTFSLNGGGGETAGSAERLVIGNEGDDTLDASAATTSISLYGMAGSDTLMGGAAGDRLSGGDNDDRLLGGAGDDRLSGDDDVDRVIGGDGIDICSVGRASGSCDPSIRVVPTTVAAGDPLTVTGAGWYPENGEVELSLLRPDGSEPQALAALPSSLEEWTIEGTITAPNAGGDFTLIACQPCDDPDAERPSQLLTVRGAASEPTISVEPDIVLLGASVLVSGENWDPQNGPISLFAKLPGVPPSEAFSTVSADEIGHFEYELGIAGLGLGSHEVRACQRCGQPGAIEQTTSFTVRAGIAPTFLLLPPTASTGESLQAVGEGWDPDRGRVRVFVDAASMRDEPDAITRVQPDGTFEVSVVVPELDAGAYTVIACQRCDSPNAVQQTATLTISGGLSPLTWILAGAVAALVLAVAVGILARRAARQPKPPPGPPEVRLHAVEPTVTIVAEDDFAPKHEIRLIPHADPGVQQVREESRR